MNNINSVCISGMFTYIHEVELLAYHRDKQLCGILHSQMYDNDTACGNTATI